MSKLACFFAGCCYGLPYDGVGCVIYPSGLNISLIPVQLLETVTFMIIFIICILLMNNKNIISKYQNLKKGFSGIVAGFIAREKQWGKNSSKKEIIWRF